MDSTTEFLQRTRVFWHEFGHFTGQFLNKQFYSGLGTVHLVVKRKALENQRTDYVGDTQPIAPDGYQIKDPIKDPATMIASVVYGCFFQCRRYEQRQLRACLGPYHERVHGHHDYEKVMLVHRECLPDPSSRNELDTCIQSFFERLWQRPEFEALFKIDIADLISSEEDEFYLDLKELEERFSVFLYAHQDFYLEFVEALRMIFARYGKAGVEK